MPASVETAFASELVCGADFWCKLMCGAGPVDLGGPGVDFGRNPKKTGPNFFSQAMS